MDAQTRLAVVVITFWVTVALAAAAGKELPKIRPAPEFTLTNQDGKLRDLQSLLREGKNR